MPQFLFHLYEGDQVLTDREGIDCQDQSASIDTAVTCAGHIIGHDALDGLVDLEAHIVTADHQGMPAGTCCFTM